MSWGILALFCSLLVLCYADQYTDRYDNINIDEILSNKRLLTSYVKCVLDQGRCTLEGKELKEHVIDGMQTACSKCTDFQKKGARKVIKHLRENESKSWEKIKKKYDPDNKYKEIYETFLDADD